MCHAGTLCGRGTLLVVSARWRLLAFVVLEVNFEKGTVGKRTRALAPGRSEYSVNRILRLRSVLLIENLVLQSS